MEHIYYLESILWLAPRKVITDSETANLIFTALCDFYGIDEDEIKSEWDNTGFKYAEAEFDVNGNKHTIKITRETQGV